MDTRKLFSYVVALSGIALVTVVFLPLHDLLQGKPGTVAFVEVIVVVLVAMHWGTRPAIAASAIGVLSWDYFFLHSRFGFSITNVENGVLLVAFLVTSIIVGQLSARATRRAEEAEASRHEVERLNADLQRENQERRRADDSLRKAQDQSELRVLERTSELKRANELFALEILERKRIEQELIESREQLRSLSAHLEAIREEERKHIAMEIHDELGQLLTALKMEISLLRTRFAGDEDAVRKIGDIREQVEKTIHVVRDVATQLRPAALNLGIVPALEWLAENFSRRNHIPCKTDIRCGEVSLGDAQATTIFRIVQESLTNVMRHASASGVEVRLAREDEGLYLQIRDDGRGFDPQAVRKDISYGLLGIRERARLIGGLLSIDSAPGEGTTVSMRIPFECSKPR